MFFFENLYITKLTRYHEETHTSERDTTSLPPCFAALGDYNRLILLDKITKSPGATLSDLEQALPHMSRFGVMKHLKVLENAGLVQTRKEGRFKHHYIVTAPIEKDALPWLKGLLVTSH